jgi:hypothetical protein
LAASIQLKKQGIEYDEIWIEFDLLRHGTVGTKFTRAENIRTFRKLQEIAEMILATDENNPPARLNSECGWCKVKSTCPLLQKALTTGSSVGLDPATQLQLRATLEYQRKGIVAAINELDDLILARAQNEDEIEYLTDTDRIFVTVSKRSSVDGEMVRRVIGDELFSQYGGTEQITVTNFKRLMKDGRLSSNQVHQLNGLLGIKLGEPSLKVESRGFLADAD